MILLLKNITKNKQKYKQFDVKYIRKGGEIFWGRVSVSPIISNDKIESVVAITIDITEERQNKELLNIKDDIIKTSFNGIIISDSNNEIVYSSNIDVNYNTFLCTKFC